MPAAIVVICLVLPWVNMWGFTEYCCIGHGSRNPVMWGCMLIPHNTCSSLLSKRKMFILKLTMITQKSFCNKSLLRDVPKKMQPSVYDT